MRLCAPGRHFRVVGISETLSSFGFIVLDFFLWYFGFNLMIDKCISSKGLFFANTHTKPARKDQLVLQGYLHEYSKHLRHTHSSYSKSHLPQGISDCLCYCICTSRGCLLKRWNPCSTFKCVGLIRDALLLLLPKRCQ